MRIDLQPVHLMPHEFIRSSIDRRGHGLAAAPCFEHHDSERLISARHTHDIAGFVEIGQRAVPLETDEARRVGNTQLMRTVLKLAAHFAVTGKYELGAWI